VDFTLEALTYLVEFISLAHVGLKLKPKRPNARVYLFKCASPSKLPPLTRDHSNSQQKLLACNSNKKLIHLYPRMALSS
jgi:hypothetical protein